METVDRLRKWRLGVVKQRSAEAGKPIPAFLVATDAVLIGIASDRPSSVPALARVKGIHKRLVSEHGEEILTILRES
jgi:DNA helicase-2/ATP-dependent DNA helicase PcrA